MSKTSCDLTIIILYCMRPLQNKETPKLRGFFGNLYRNRAEFHHHGDTGLIYRHPLIQYKTISGTGRIMGLEKGAFLLQAVDIPKAIEIDRERIEILESKRTTEQIQIGSMETSIEYRFVTPWLALNEINYKRFISTKSITERENILNGILVGNILSLCKSIGFSVEGRLVSSMRIEGTQQIEIKNCVKLLGITGIFTVNFALPNWWGIGKQSARGFGTIQRIEE